MNPLSLPKEVQEAIKNNTLIAFVGAGFSKGFGLPSWNDLAINTINSFENGKYKTLIPALEEGVLTALEVLDKLHAEKSSVHNYIDKNFCIDPIEKDFITHKNLLKLTSKIITTNYDNAFELADPNLYTAIHNSEFKLINLKNNSRYLFKIHGCAKTDAAECIVFTKDYESLYSKETAAIFKLKDLFINNTFLFIGFSMNDPYVKNILQYIDNLFNNNSKHFIITTSPDIAEGLSYIRPIALEDYNQLPIVIKNWADSKEDILNHKQVIQTSTAAPVNKVINSRIALLSPDPVDLDLYNELPNVTKLFDGLSVIVHTGTLNAKNLQLIDEFDYLVIVTKSYKGKIYIESENLKSEVITVSELNKLIPNEQIPILLITEGETTIDIKSKLAWINTYKNNIINRFIFKFIKNTDIIKNDESIYSYNITEALPQLLKGKLSTQSLTGNKKHLDFSIKRATVIGRIEEQSTIASRMIGLSHSNKLLNIKGSGGIGKTTLIRKVSSDLYDRGYFNFGVTFNSCETVKSYQEFIDLLAKGFKLSNIENLKEYLQENNEKFDTLIILDNFESISNIESKSDYKEILSLLEFATDYASIVVTSRENLEMDFEDVYNLTPLTSDDALKLFLNYYGDIRNSQELLTLRTDILENLLNNNPLAIKLVTRTVSKQSGIGILRDQLKNFFFESTGEDFANIYNKDVDVNIERTKSLFQSINYSYCKLLTREKLALEILHLFPDGISVSNFKQCFLNKKSENNITDIELKALQNKSLVENIDGSLHLQPIVRKFAEYQFSKRSKETKDKYYKDAYSFNCFVLDTLEEVSDRRTFSQALVLHNYYKENLMFTLEYLSNIIINPKSNIPHKRYLLNYVRNLSQFIFSESQLTHFRKELANLETYFSDLDYADKFIKTLRYQKIYFYNDFDESYKILQELFPYEEIKNRVFESEDFIENRYKSIISRIHSMEGHTLDYVESFIKNGNKGSWLIDVFFYLGIHVNLVRSDIDFYKYEIELINNSVDIPSVEKYIGSLFQEEHLERMQTTYTLSKIKAVNRDQIKPLVVTNPYTKGLKELMYAFVEEDVIKKKARFKKALFNLKHIKYYYLECLYFFSEFLLETDDVDFDQVYQEGLSLSKKFFYQYLDFKFSTIRDKSKYLYICSYDYYPTAGIQDFVQDNIIEWEKFLKKGK